MAQKEQKEFLEDVGLWNEFRVFKYPFRDAFTIAKKIGIYQDFEKAVMLERKVTAVFNIHNKITRDKFCFFCSEKIDGKDDIIVTYHGQKNNFSHDICWRKRRCE